MSMNEIEAKCRELRSLQRLIEEAQQEAEAIKDTIKAQLTAQGVDEFQAGEYRVSWKTVTTTRIDAKVFQQAFPEVAQAFNPSPEDIGAMAAICAGVSAASMPRPPTGVLSPKVRRFQRRLR